MEKNYWKLHEDVAFGRSGGKIIWQPRMDCWISDRMFEYGELPGEYKGCTKAEIYRKLGCSARVYEYNGCFYKTLPPNIKGSSKQLNDTTWEHKIETPVGTVTQVTKSSKNSWATLVTKQWAEDADDLKVWTYIEENSDWHWNQDWFDRTKEEWGNLGAPTVFIPRVSMQNLYIDLMGVENTVYTLTDSPDAVESYFKALSDSHMRLLDVINPSPIAIINFGDNLHSGTLSPALFEKYVLKEYQKRCEKLHQANKFVMSHYDGNNRGLMEYYQETGLDGIEAITPFPQGDVDMNEVKKYLGDMFLIDGLPAIYFDELYDLDVLIQETEKIIHLFAPHLILGISDEISSTGNIERIKVVGEIVDRYNAQF